MPVRADKDVVVEEVEDEREKGDFLGDPSDFAKLDPLPSEKDAKSAR